MLKREMTPEITEVVKEVHEELQDISKTVNKVNDLLDISLTFYNVKTILAGAYDEVSSRVDVIKELNDKIDDERKYEVEGDDIVFYKDRKDTQGDKYKEKISVPIDLAGDMCYDFTYGGLSGPQVIQKYEIKPEVWSTLKSRLRIYKHSNALPEVVLEYIEAKYGNEGVEEKIVEVSHKAVDDKFRGRFVKQYDKQRERLDDKMRKSYANVENFMSMLQAYLGEYEPKQLDFVYKPSKNTDVVTYAFSDIHLGKTGTQRILERINIMTQDIIESPEGVVKIFGLGDMVETLVEGGMHTGQVEHMEGPFGFDLIMKAVQALETMLIDIHRAGKKVEFFGIGGNHDRMGRDHNQDMERTGALVIYELVKRGLKNTDIQINILREKFNAIDVDGVNYIIHHGDDNVSSKNAKDLLWEQGDPDKYNVLMVGDKHHKEEFDVSSNATKIILPAMAGSGEYDKRLSLSSAPGYMMFKNTENGLESTTKRLQN